MQQVSAATVRDRNSLLDGCRIFSSIAILWMHSWESGHMGDVGEIGRFGVPFFTACATFLLMQSFFRRRDRPFLEYLKNRIVRLYLPFLAWGALGLLLMIIKHRFVSHVPLSPIGPDFFLDGASFQLWYLPFLLLISVAFFPLCSAGAALGRRGQLLLGAILIIAMALPIRGPRPHAMGPGDSKFQYYVFITYSLDALPSAFFGAALALVLKDRKAAPWVGWLGLIITTAATAVVTATHRGCLLETISGAGLLIFAISGKTSAYAVGISKYAFLAYGIYLAQNVVLEPIQALLTRARIQSSWSVETSVFLAAFIGTASISILLHHSQKTRWLLG